MHTFSADTKLEVVYEKFLIETVWSSFYINTLLNSFQDLREVYDVGLIPLDNCSSYNTFM